VFADVSATVDAYDVSPTLIIQAREKAKSEGIRNVRFRVGDIADTRWPQSSYDAVSCMGVLSTIIDEWAFLNVAVKIRNAVRHSGFVLLRDTVSLSTEGQLVQSDTYAIRYREEDHYRRTMANLGMKLEYEAALIETKTLANRIYLYRLHSLPAT
jgi:2-polyprenyl-3-methyl-5-hydroxy-6-metoxy-1,4-benzoquinol methylase